MRHRHRLNRTAVAIDTSFFGALMALCTAALWPIYQTPQLVVLSAVAVTTGCAIALLGAVYRWPGYAVVAGTVAAFLVLGVPLAVPGQAIMGILPSFAGLRDLVAGSALGWRQLLTVDLPVGQYQALLVPALVLLLAGSVAGLSVVTRAPRGEWGILAPVVIAVAAIVLGPSTARWPIPLGLAFLLVSIFWMTWRARRRRRAAIALLSGQTRDPAESTPADHRGVVRPVLTAVVVLAVAVGAGVSGAALLAPAGERDVLRSAVERPFDPRLYASPLSGFRSYWAKDTADAPLFDVSGLPDGARIRLATMDTYNGIVYSVGDDQTSSASGFFARVPSSIDRTGEAGTRLSIDITIEGYRGVWLPTVGDLESVAFGGPDAAALQDALFVNRTTGTGAVLGGVGEGDAYRLETVLPDVPTRDEIARAQPGAAEVPPATGVPEELATAVAADTEGLIDPGQKLLAVVDAVRSAGYVSHGTVDGAPYSRSGHAADRIAELLTAPLMLGDGEQYAATVALMARELGFPARVVLGFVPPAGSSTITGADVAAWVEVDLDGLGWVAVDPTPEVRDIPEQVPETSEQISKPRVAVPPPPVADDTPVEPNKPDVDEKDADRSNELWAVLLAVVRIAGTVALVLLVLAAPFISVVVAKAVRRRRRRRDSDRLARITGGWQEIVDAAADYGYRVPQSATRLELAGEVAKADVLELARAADAAVFDDADPRAEDADDYWRALDLLRASWAREYTRRERIAAAVAFRSLRRRAPRGTARGRRR